MTVSRYARNVCLICMTLSKGMNAVNSFEIHGKLPSLNEVINANRTNRYAGAKLKRDIEILISAAISAAIKNGSLRPIEQSCIICIQWYEATRRRDADNIQSSQKFILDALVKCGILKNDSRKYVTQIYHEIVDGNENMVIVNLESV